MKDVNSAYIRGRVAPPAAYVA